jgi:hypothetical protein
MMHTVQDDAVRWERLGGQQVRGAQSQRPPPNRQSQRARRAHRELGLALGCHVGLVGDIEGHEPGEGEQLEYLPPQHALLENDACGWSRMPGLSAQEITCAS